MTNYEVMSDGNKRSKNQGRALLRVEGETLNYSQIANRLGVSLAAATSRMRRLRNASGPITWERLRAIGQ